MIKTLKQIFNSLKKFYKKSSIWTKIVILIIILFFLAKVANSNTPKLEGFSQNRKFVVKNNNDLYDKFYCHLYDKLLYDSKRNDYEVTKINELAKINKNSRILDLGSGKGHHVKHYTFEGVNIEGIDKSKDMIESSQKAYPKCNFKHGSVLNGMNYQSDEFSHALCLFFTVYYIKNKRKFFENVYKWLQPGGYFILHLVNRDLFDPITPASD